MSDVLVASDITNRLQLKTFVTSSDCHEWAGATVKGGYGVMRVNKKNYRTHRIAWELTNGPIPNGLCVLHRCDNPPCLNIEHLFLGTQAETVADMSAKGRVRNQNSNVTHCINGHAFNEPNTYLSRGKRYCRTCHRTRQRNVYVAAREAQVAK